MDQKTRTGRITGLFSYKEKGSMPKTWKEVRITRETGMEGDFHGGDEMRQLSLLPQEARTWMEEQEEKGLCFEKFKENFRIEGLDFRNMKKGEILQAEEIRLEVTGIFKKCHPDVCTLAAEGKECRLREQGIFVRVLEGGTIRLGEKIRVS
ncbi:MAG: hypothetical protein Q4D55_07830 [Eubacteriales bacterium]|nr:hypothetical protein [Eubacteriales bacterium]